MTDQFSGAERTVHIARVGQYHAGYNYYIVTLQEGGDPRRAVAGGTSFGIGANAHHVYPPGTPVVVLEAKGVANNGSRSAYLEILGSLQVLSQGKFLGNCDSADLLSGVGYLHDKVHNFKPTERTDLEGPVLAGAGVPMDALSGEQSMSSPLGPGWLIGLAMAYLRAGDRCGIWMFTLDEHLRVLAKSLEQQTVAREVLDLYDDGETSVIERVALVPWEAYGSFESGTPVGKVTTANAGDPLAPPKDYPVNTVELDQSSVFRLLSLRGYLGDLRDEFVGLPVGASGLHRSAGTTEVMQGVFRQITGADGRYVVQSAKGIHFEKYPLIQFPVGLRAAGDPEGDTPENYRASGVYGAGETQKREDFKPEDNKCPGDRGILGLALHGAYISKASLQTLRAHKKDWRVQDESKVPLKEKLGKGTYADDSGKYTVDPMKMWMPLPKYVDLPVQKDRWEAVRYYAGRSAIDMWDDGSVVIEDAWGSQIIMAGGNIVLTCPGDIIQAPGRSSITLAPQDIIQRAGNSVDITSTRRDVTIKAEKGLKLLGGNAAGGGVLIENRAPEGDFDYKENGEKTAISGLVLRSAGTLVAYSEGISLLAKEDVVVQAKEVQWAVDTWHCEARTSVSIALGTPLLEGDIDAQVVYSFGKSECLLGVGKQEPSLVLGGPVYALGALSVRGDMDLAGALQASGSIATAGVLQARSTEVTEIPREIIKYLGRLGAEIVKLVNALTATPLVAVQTTRADTNKAITAPSTYYNKVEVEEKAKVSLRTPQDYRTNGATGFILAQWRWQQYLGDTGKTWEEKPVKCSGVDTYPWPGPVWLQDSQAYLVYDLGAFDAEKGHATDGGDSTAPKVTKSSAQTGYLVNTQET